MIETSGKKHEVRDFRMIFSTGGVAKQNHPGPGWISSPIMLQYHQRIRKMDAVYRTLNITT